MYNRFAYTCLILAPVLSNYAVYSAFALGDLFVILFFGLVAFSKNSGNALHVKGMKSAAFLAFFLLYSISLVLLLDYETINTGFYRLVFYCSVVLVIPMIRWDSSRMLSIAEKLALIFSCSLFAQFLLYHTGSIVIFKLPLEQYEVDSLELVDHIYRGAGWFREPSYFALVVLPVLIYQARSAKWLGLTICALALLASTSSLAFFAFAVVICDLLFRDRKKLSSWFKLAASVSVVALAVVSFQDLPVASRFIDIASGGGSFATRVLPFFDFLGDAMQLFPVQHHLNPALSLSISGEVWLSSALYIATLFGLVALLFIPLGLAYLGWFFLSVVIVLLFVTSIASTSFFFYIAATMYCLRINSVVPRLPQLQR